MTSLPATTGVVRSVALPAVGPAHGPAGPEVARPQTPVELVAPTPTERAKPHTACTRGPSWRVAVSDLHQHLEGVPHRMLTREDDADAHALRGQGWTITAIAKHLGHARKTIRAFPCQLLETYDPDHTLSPRPSPRSGRHCPVDSFVSVRSRCAARASGRANWARRRRIDLGGWRH